MDTKKRIERLQIKVNVSDLLPPWVFDLPFDTVSALAKHYRYEPFNLDTMDKKQIMKIRGIGEKKAAEIIAVRQRNCFKDVKP